MSETDEEIVRRVEGMYVGSLTKSEAAAFERCVENLFACRSYEGAGGFLGSAKVRLIRLVVEGEG